MLTLRSARLALVVMGCLLLAASGCRTTSGPVMAGPLTAPEGVGERALRLACRLANYASFQEAAWTHLPAIGVKYVFMNVPAPGEVEATQKRLEGHGLTALVMRGEADFTKDSAPEDLEGQLAACEAMSVKYMFLSIKGHWPDREVVYARLRRAGDAARRHGVTLALETHPELGTNGDVQLETMKGVAHPNVRVNFDTGNITYYNKGTDAVAELRKIVEYVATVEIKDHNAQFETWNFPALGKGRVDIPGVLRVLKANGYAGPITIEVEGIKGIERDEAAIRRDVADSVAYLRTLGRFE